MTGALGEWSDFNVAMAGASAALAGLVIVAASVNIDKIIRAGTLTARLGAAIAALVLALVASALGLVPRLDLTWYGIILLVCAVAAGMFAVHAMRVLIRDNDPEQRARGAKAVLGFLPVAGYLAAGVALIAGSPVGLVLTAVGCLLAVVAAIVMSWVVLVEVLR
ncbi:hypothetical protein HD600_001885 [Microbacterium ginsengiterrae]|uniref:Modulator of FtsH protease n=1 Tax=Microbacterium ginsengiterrae TaxID=546115 RepID=A0A7W9CDB0_9MICO|nr:hypothetical protein [Microbacterium ginsengiterrae]MBB5743388.1 hypothetical protein [Microbacterium ginsengiterrae]